MKNIVICCDGTGNQFGDQNSNVVKLYRALPVIAGQQISYYHPGVGTMGDKSALTAPGKLWTKVKGLAFGYGLSENIADAYRYLMFNFKPEDKVFIFGFSRGAYTARALCGLLQMFGLLAPGNEGMIPYALRLYKSSDQILLPWQPLKPNKFTIAAQFKKTFCTECKPHFAGLWDTVSSVGWILDPIGLKPGSLPYTAGLGDVSIIRHAVSLDERRAFFRQNLITEQAGRDMKQVWFAGVHSDVGGSYPEAESGMSKVTLKWMLHEAHDAGLILDGVDVDAILGGELRFAKPYPSAIMHNSLKGFWVIGEFWPKFAKKRVSPPGAVPERFVGHPRLNLFKPRYVPDGACIHESVFRRKKLVPTYQPKNLPSTYTTAPDTETDPYPVSLEAGQSAVIGVHSSLKWNDTALMLRKEGTYRLEAAGSWYDASIKTGPAGYANGTLFMRLFEGLRRRPRDNWFALIGAVGQEESNTFLIGDGVELTVQEDGILNCYANDLPHFYGNNSGWITLTVTRIS